MDYQLGRKPPTPTKPRLMLSQIMTGIIPEIPPMVDYLAKLTDWQVLGNSDYGNCVAVTAANALRLTTSALTTEVYPSLDEVLTLYKTQNPNFPNDDNGMNIQDCLNWWNHNEWSGHKIVAFAQVDLSKLDEVKSAIAIFGWVWLGVNVQAQNMAQFDMAQPWDYDGNAPVLGGHSILGGGYLGDAARDITFVTWGKETSFTDNFWMHAAEECWIAILPEVLGTKQFSEGIDAAKLANAYQTLTHHALPIPLP